MTFAEATDLLELSRAEPFTAADLRRAYLRAVKRHNPETDPAGFQRIRAAFECLRDAAVDAASAPPAPIAIVPESPAAEANLVVAAEPAATTVLDRVLERLRERDFDGAERALAALNETLRTDGEPETARGAFFRIQLTFARELSACTELPPRLRADIASAVLDHDLKRVHTLFHYALIEHGNFALLRWGRPMRKKAPTLAGLLLQRSSLVRPYRKMLLVAVIVGALIGVIAAQFRQPTRRSVPQRTGRLGQIHGQRQQRLAHACDERGILALDREA